MVEKRDFVVLVCTLYCRGAEQKIVTGLILVGQLLLNCICMPSVLCCHLLSTDQSRVNCNDLPDFTEQGI